VVSCWVNEGGVEGVVVSEGGESIELEEEGSGPVSRFSPTKPISFSEGIIGSMYCVDDKWLFSDTSTFRISKGVTS